MSSQKSFLEIISEVTWMVLCQKFLKEIIVQKNCQKTTVIVICFVAILNQKSTSITLWLVWASWLDLDLQFFSSIYIAHKGPRNMQCWAFDKFLIEKTSRVLIIES